MICPEHVRLVGSHALSPLEGEAARHVLERGPRYTYLSISQFRFFTGERTTVITGPGTRRERGGTHLNRIPYCWCLRKCNVMIG